MRILFVSFINNSHSTGMGRWTHSVATAMASQGHETKLWFLEDFPIVARSFRLAIVGFPLALAYRMIRAKNNFDAAIVHEPSGSIYAPLRRLSRSLPPIIAMCHNVERKVFAE